MFGLHFESVAAACVFKAFDIDCEKYGIDEYMLVLWDDEVLFATYNIRKSLENELAENAFHEEWSGKLNEYKMERNKYSDVFNYGDYSYTYEKYTTSQIMEHMSINVMAFYKKYNMNFREESK